MNLAGSGIWRGLFSDRSAPPPAGRGRRGGRRPSLDVVPPLPEAGKDVLTETPYALGTDEADAVGDLAQRYGVAVLTTVPRVATTRSAGPPSCCAGSAPGTGSRMGTTGAALPRRRPQATGGRAPTPCPVGGVLLDTGYHAVNVLRDLFGVPESVAPAFGHLAPRMRGQRLEDAASASP